MYGFCVLGGSKESSRLGHRSGFLVPSFFSNSAMETLFSVTANARHMRLLISGGKIAGVRYFEKTALVSQGKTAHCAVLRIPCSPYVVAEIILNNNCLPQRNIYVAFHAPLVRRVF